MVDLYALYQDPFALTGGFLLVLVWIVVWKGLALWFSAKNQQKGWFIALLILNTAGLLPIIYLIWFRPKEDEEDEEEKPKKKSNKKSAEKSHYFNF